MLNHQRITFQNQYTRTQSQATLSKSSNAFWLFLRSRVPPSISWSFTWDQLKQHPLATTCSKIQNAVWAACHWHNLPMLWRQKQWPLVEEYFCAYSSTKLMFFPLGLMGIPRRLQNNLYDCNSFTKGCLKTVWHCLLQIFSLWPTFQPDIHSC